MYKKQLRVQKILCLAAIIASALVFLYALGIMTDLYDSLYDTMRNPRDVFQTDVPGSVVYYNMQEFNRMFLNCSIGMILLGVLLYVTNTHVRRRYYIGNYCATLLYAAGSVAISVFGHKYIEIFKDQFLQVDFAALKDHAELWDTLYTESTFWFDLHYFVFAVLLVVAALLVFNAIWKGILMNEEKQLIGMQKADPEALTESRTGTDRMRFIKNTQSSRLCYLGILLNVFYFVSIYESDVGSYYYKYQIGMEIVYNLIFMLAVFLASEGVKNYKKNYSYILTVLGIVQIIRIFILPLQAHTATIAVQGKQVLVMGNAQFIRVAIYLALSGLCLIMAASINLRKCAELEDHMKSMHIQDT